MLSPEFAGDCHLQNQMTESEQKRSFGLMPEALLVALLTAGAYWLAFRYEAGYLSVFRLPVNLVEVSAQTVLTVLLAVSGIIWVVFWAANLVLMLWPKHPAIQEKVFRVCILLLVPLWQLLNYGPRRQDWVLYVVILPIVAFVEFLWPYLVFSERPTYRERIIADELAESRVRERGIGGRVMSAFGPAAYALLLFIVFGSMFASSAGKAKGTTQKDFLVFESDPNTAVIRVYDDTIIAMPFDRKSKRLKSQVIIHKMSNQDVTLNLEKDLGPLTWR